MENNENKPSETQSAEVSAERKSFKAKCCEGLKKNKKTVLGVLILLLIIGYAAYAKNPNALGSLFTKNLTPDQAKAKVADFVKSKNLIPTGTDFSIKNVTEESGIYKLDLSVGGQDYTSYMTKDGKTFFVQGIDMTAADNKQQSDQQAAAPKDIPKSDTPDVKLFVMSYCPFGTQMEKGILPALKTLGNKIKYTLEFVDYSMHNDQATGDRKELDENLRQYCIQKNQPAVLNTYLTCFLKKGQGTENSCMTLAGVNASQIKSCMDQTDAQFNVTKDFNDKSTWSGGQFPPFDVNKDDNDKYGVQGSPTLVINGVEAQPAGRDSASILKTICSAFNNAPSVCTTAKLSSTAPASGFGDGAAPAANSGSASCGN